MATDTDTAVPGDAKADLQLFAATKCATMLGLDTVEPMVAVAIAYIIAEVIKASYNRGRDDAENGVPRG